MKRLALNNLLCWLLAVSVMAEGGSGLKPLPGCTYFPSGKSDVPFIKGIPKDSVCGFYQYVEGVIDSCLKFDGYTTRVIRKGSDLPKIESAMTIEAWVALQALPWNWTAIVDQGGREIPVKSVELPQADLNNLSKGLIGAIYNDPNLKRPSTKNEFTSTENDWTGGLNDWSVRWRGYIEAPYTGEIIFMAEADDGVRLLINNQPVIDGWMKNGIRKGRITLVKGERYPVVLDYYNDGGDAFLRLSWSWEGRDEVLIPVGAFGYCDRDVTIAIRDIVPLKEPEKEYENRIFLGIDAYGHLGLKLNIDGKIRECISEQKLPLLKWNYIAATFDQRDGMKIFINGALAGELKFRGILSPSAGSDLLIGASLQKMGPADSERKASANILSKMVIDGLIDEVQIRDLCLSPEEIRANYQRIYLKCQVPLKWPKMPSGPDKLPVNFDAVYTRLNYTDAWDARWRISDFPDILIHFDNLPVRYIFWHGTGYGGVWITENGIFMGDQSLERANEGKSPWGCSEHMSDKQARYSSVRIIEKNDARIVIQWRYAISDITYSIFGSANGIGWGEWADEYYYIYPDGISTRYQILWTGHLSHEWQETIVLNQPGTYPEDNIEINALSLADMKGECKTYSWENGPPVSFSEPKEPNIQLVHLKSAFRPFIIFEPGPIIRPFRGSIRPEYSYFPWWNHWPVAQLPNDGRLAAGPDRPSHSSLSQSVEGSSVIHDRNDGSFSAVSLIGMTNDSISSLVSLARSWNFPAEIINEGQGIVNMGYDKNQRAYIISASAKEDPSGISFTLNASGDSPVVNPAFVIKDWDKKDIELRADNTIVDRGKTFRYGYNKRLDGNDLIIWIQAKYTEPVNIMIKPL